MNVKEFFQNLLLNKNSKTNAKEVSIYATSVIIRELLVNGVEPRSLKIKEAIDFLKRQVEDVFDLDPRSVALSILEFIFKDESRDYLHAIVVATFLRTPK